MIEFCFLDKTQKNEWLPILFDLFYENMKDIVPLDHSYEEEKREWLSNVLPAIDKAPRQIILCFSDNVFAGYVQYYTRNELLMIEEVQVKPQFWRTRVFYKMCRFLMQSLPSEIEIIEAYANKQNLNSQMIMRNLGMVRVDEKEDFPFIHLRGNAQEIKRNKLSR